jgi:hypothetical protein
MLRWGTMFTRSVTSVVMFVLVGCSSPSNDAVLPDVRASLRMDRGSERTQNTRDEYAPLIRRYGKPTSILSSEDDPANPPVPSMIVRYDAAHVKIALVPIGCVSVYLDAAEMIGGASRYPALAQDFVDRMRAHPCVRSTPGWTIMGYVDSSDNTDVSAEFARFLLGGKRN